MSEPRVPVPCALNSPDPAEQHFSSPGSWKLEATKGITFAPGVRHHRKRDSENKSINEIAWHKMVAEKMTRALT